MHNDEQAQLVALLDAELGLEEEEGEEGGSRPPRPARSPLGVMKLVQSLTEKIAPVERDSAETPSGREGASGTLKRWLDERGIHHLSLVEAWELVSSVHDD